ncbi:MAG: alpha/beta hydrolase [Acidobacteria bacterium]|nr:alpha/beta hydrolase [Acidobacteriota bacterium]
MLRCLFTLFLLLLAAALRGGEPLVVGEVFRLQAPQLGEERPVLLSLPQGYENSRERYPVLVLLDGNAHLLHTRGTVDFLVRNGLMPDVILVALPNTNRTRDLSPTPGRQRREDGSFATLPGSGGGEAFLDFIEKTLLPDIEGKYRTQPFRLLAGHSLGGLLALHTLATRPHLFQGIIAASPALAWDEEHPLRALEAFFRARPTLRATLFASMADEEAGDPRPSRFERLRSLLKDAKAGPHFAWEARGFPEEDHGSVVLRSHYWGLRKIFEGWRLPVDPRTRQFAGGVKELRAHYERLALRLGYPVPPPELVVNTLGYQALARNNGGLALTFFRHNVELYPESPNVHDSLGEALEKEGQAGEAARCYARAVALAEQAKDPRLPVYQKNRQRLASPRKD